MLPSLDAIGPRMSGVGGEGFERPDLTWSIVGCWKRTGGRSGIRLRRERRNHAIEAPNLGTAVNAVPLPIY